MVLVDVVVVWFLLGWVFFCLFENFLAVVMVISLWGELNLLKFY